MEVIEIPKNKTYTKRKNEILKELEVQPEKTVEEKPEVEELPKITEPVLTTEDVVEPPTKKTRITKEDECTKIPEKPSWMRGAIVKPLLLAGVASLSLWVNNFYQTNHPPVEVKKNTIQTQKTKTQGLQRSSFVFESKPRRTASIVPGFTTN